MFGSSSFVLRGKPATFALSSVLLVVMSWSPAAAWAAAPSVVIDTQHVVGSQYNNPQGIAVNNTNQGAIFIADTNSNQLVALLNNFNYTFQPNGFQLSTPQGLALDSKGDLFVADTPTVNGTTYGRIIELPADSTGNMDGTAKLIFSGAPLSNPIAITVDNTGTLFIGDFKPTGEGAIYSLAPGATAPQLLNITNGPPSQWFPASVIRDASSNLYFVDNGNLQGGIGGVYRVSTAGGAATQITAPNFVINQPSAVTLTPAGDLYILTVIGQGRTNIGQQLLVIPAASPSTPYILPNSGIVAGSSMALDANNNLDVVDTYNNNVVQVNYINPTDLGTAYLGMPGNQVSFNIEFNAPATLRGFRVVSQGDVSTEITQVSGGTCTNGAHNAASPSTPYTCTETYQATPTYPGGRTVALQIKGPNNTILGSAPVSEIGAAASAVTYPLTATTTVTGLYQPQAVAISGLDKTVYIADSLAGRVYATNGIGGSTITPVATGSFQLQSPQAVALDGAGNLFIADFTLAQVIEVPTASGQAPSLVNTGGLLQHPISLAIDSQGDLYVGDAGPAGYGASTGNPGYVVKIPSTGTPFKMALTGVSVVYPQALTTDVYSGYLFIGDGGDLSGVGQLDVALPDGSSSSQVFVDSTNPSGLAFDPAGNLYILDGTTNIITVDPRYAADTTNYHLQFDNTSLNAASSLAISAGGQSFVVVNLGNGDDNTLVYLNGNRSKLAFGGQAVGTQSQPLTATIANVGDVPLTLRTPYYSSTTNNPAFNLLGSSSCGNNPTIQTGTSCSVSFTFTPSAVGQTSQQFTFNSDAYNSGVPILTVQGTGRAGGAIAKKPKK